MIRGDLELDFGAETPRVVGIWGFSPFRDEAGADHAYATLHYGRFRTVIAHFLPAPGASAAGGFVRRWCLNRIVLGSLEGDRATCYESKRFTGEDGCPYLMYSASEARHRNVHIFVQRMIDPATPDPSFAPRALLSPQGLRSEDRNPGYIQLVEGANIARIGDWYVLLYSVGDFARNNYKLGVAYSRELIPAEGRQYAKPLIDDPRNIWRNSGVTGEVCYLLQSEHKGWPNYCGHLVSGPGHGNIVKIGGAYHLVFHGYRTDDRLRRPRDRYVWMLPLDVRVGRGKPSQWIRPVLPRACDPGGARQPGA